MVRARGNREEEGAKLSASLALFQELGMPGERDKVEAELAKTRAARVGNPEPNGLAIGHAAGDGEENEKQNGPQINADEHG